MKQLYPDQQEAFENIIAEFKKGKKGVIFRGPTGTGKTVIGSYLVKYLVEKEKAKVLIMSDRIFLNGAFLNDLVDFGLMPFRIDQKTRSLNIAYNVYVAMSQTLRRRIKNTAYLNWISSSFDYIIIDECHKEAYNYYLEHKVFGDAKLLGLSATPRRHGKQRQLYFDYEVIVEGLNEQDLIAINRLAKPTYIYDEGFKVNTKKIKVVLREGEYDFDDKQASKVMSIDKIGRNVIPVFKAHGNNERSIAFCNGSASVIKWCLEFNKHGIKSKFYISPPQEKEGMELYEKYYKEYSGTYEQIKAQHSKDEFVVLFNNLIFTTGYDDPLIRNVLIIKLTMNGNVLNQMCGRGGRFVKGIKEEFRIFDFSDNLTRLGKWHVPKKYKLKHRISGDGEAPMKKCPKCQGYVFATIKKCNCIDAKTKSICNFVFPLDEKHSVELNIQVKNYDDLVYSDFIRQRNSMTWDEIEKYRQSKGFKLAWMFRIAEQMNRLPEFKQTSYYEQLTTTNT